MLAYHDVKKLLMAVANKYDLTIDEVFIVLCTCGTETHDVAVTIMEWEHGRYCRFVVDNSIDLMTGKIIPVLMKKGA